MEYLTKKDYKKIIADFLINRFTDEEGSIYFLNLYNKHKETSPDFTRQLQNIIDHCTARYKRLLDIAKTPNEDMRNKSYYAKGYIPFDWVIDNKPGCWMENDNVSDFDNRFNDTFQDDILCFNENSIEYLNSSILGFNELKADIKPITNKTKFVLLKELGFFEDLKKFNELTLNDKGKTLGYILSMSDENAKDYYGNIYLKERSQIGSRKSPYNKESVHAANEILKELGLPEIKLPNK